MHLVKKNYKITIRPSQNISWMKMNITFSSNRDILKDLENSCSEITSLLDMFFSIVEDARITLDISYSLEKEVDSQIDNIKDILDAMGYNSKISYFNEFRIFEVFKKHNITKFITLSDGQKSKSTILNLCVSVDNIIIDLDKLQTELNASLYFYASEYIRLHYNVVKTLDEGYIQDNLNFYESVMK